MIVKMYFAEGEETITRSVSLPGHGHGSTGAWGTAPVFSEHTDLLGGRENAFYQPCKKMCIKAVSGIQFSNVPRWFFFFYE